jgi:type II secretory pathway component GspD/PulD (secretin)
LRADRENSALLTTASPAVVERLRRDLQALDVPRAQVRVEASVWEFASTQEASVALEAARIMPNASWSFDARGALSLAIGPQSSTRFQARATLLASRGRARLLAKPNITVASGENGTLFLGQSRFVQVLQNFGNGNEVRALRLQIGYTLNVRPRVGVGDDILLDISPRVSTIDDIETSTRLPTLGIRETSATLRLGPGDNILLGGLDSNLEFETRGKTPLSRLAKPLAPRSKSAESRALIVLVSARKI